MFKRFGPAVIAHVAGGTPLTPSRRGASRNRDPNGRRRALSEFARKLDGSSVFLGDQASDRKSEPCASRVDGARVVRSIKTLERTQQVTRRHSHPRVSYPEHSDGILLRQINRHMLVGSGVFDCIVKENQYQLFEAIPRARLWTANGPAPVEWGLSFGSATAVQVPVGSYTLSAFAVFMSDTIVCSDNTNGDLKVVHLSNRLGVPYHRAR